MNKGIHKSYIHSYFHILYQLFNFCHIYPSAVQLHSQSHIIPKGTESVNGSCVDGGYEVNNYYNTWIFVVEGKKVS